ncbi:esterase/lipase family protein [Nocardia altamirensis]|uniref:esterase/lipase family protein n=1 Tax=Nocardia altamirensis TaxID=472158 RepID=UPI0008400192|nr:alpha/beta fold hydrolase [Nocardia altamirensis]
MKSSLTTRTRIRTFMTAALAAVALASGGTSLSPGLAAAADNSVIVTTQEAEKNHGLPPRGANNWKCKPSRAHPNPVVLVHGASANMFVNWVKISPMLADKGYCVFALTYGVPDGTPFPLNQIGGRNVMERSAVELGAFIDKVLAATKATKVDIVGHSEGSLMPNHYVKFLGGAAKVDKYVAMTPLWDGSKVFGADVLYKLARQFGLGPVIDRISGEVFASAPQFLHGSDFLNKLNAGGVAVPGITYTNIMTRYDEAVIPYTSGVMNAPNATNIVVQDLCPKDLSEHGLMAIDPVTAKVIVNALDPAHAKPVTC